MYYEELEYNLKEYTQECYYITKYLVENEDKVPEKVLHAVLDHLYNGFLTNESEKNIKHLFDTLIEHQNAPINWENITEVYELIEEVQ